MPSPISSSIGFQGLASADTAATRTVKPQPDIHEIALSLHAKRLQLISSNIANADTPNYRAVDIDFRETLRQAVQTSESKVPVAQPGVARAFTTSPSSVEYVLKSHVPIQRSVDGNTVDMDLERAKFADAAMRYQFELDRVSGEYKDMQNLLASIR